MDIQKYLTPYSLYVFYPQSPKRNTFLYWKPQISFRESYILVSFRAVKSSIASKQFSFDTQCLHAYLFPPFTILMNIIHLLSVSFEWYARFNLMHAHNTLFFRNFHLLARNFEHGRKRMSTESGR